MSNIIECHPLTDDAEDLRNLFNDLYYRRCI